MHGHFDMGYSESTFSKYAFGRGSHKKSTLCTLVKMMTIMDDPLVTQYFRSRAMSSVNWYFFMISFKLLSLHLFFGRSLVRLPKTSLAISHRCVRSHLMEFVQQNLSETAFMRNNNTSELWQLICSRTNKHVGFFMGNLHINWACTPALMTWHRIHIIYIVNTLG